METVKALFLAANPASTNRLAIDEEMRAIEQKVRTAQHRDALVFQSAWAVRPDDLLQLLNQHHPHIVHFSGHGSHTGLCLAGDDRQVRLVTTRALEVLFATLKDNIRLVFLNACYSREQAQALVATIDCVIGMKDSIHDDAATTFASSFYRAIGFGRSIQEAFDQGRTALFLEGIPEEDIPELLVKDGVDPTQIVLIGHQATSSVGLQQVPIWNVPFVRNPFFTGREDLLEQLYTQLHQSGMAALSQPQGISGLGGIGKTQLALEYTYRYRQKYQVILWAQADTAEVLNASYTEIAKVLQLPQWDKQDQEKIIQAVKDWLRSKGSWLLVLDNADDLNIVQAFLPTEYPGHLLLTTRAQAMGTVARRLEVNALDQEAGALLLLRRSGLIAPDASLEMALPDDLTLAKAIAEELGGLPLALDQAGAYIEETACELANYHQLYQTERARLLARRGGLKPSHPEPVATTWSLSFMKVEQTSPMAVELLSLCAFLAPDAIPQSVLKAVLTADVKESVLRNSLQDILDDLLVVLDGNTPKSSRTPVATAVHSATGYELNEAMGCLYAYSLITRDPHTRFVGTHRLIQVILRDSLSTQQQLYWMHRAVHAVAEAFPNPDFDNWSTCEHLLPHAFMCIAWIKQMPLEASSAALLLDRVGSYLSQRVRYLEAEPLLKQAWKIYEQTLGPTHLDTATSLYKLAQLYGKQRKYTLAEPLVKQVLEICKQTLKPTHFLITISLNKLAALYQEQEKYREAEPLLKQVLKICKQSLEPVNPETALSLHNLAQLYYRQKKYREAEPLLKQALEICKQTLKPTDSYMSTILNDLALLYQVQKKYREAEPLLKQALEISKQSLGPIHPGTLSSLANLAMSYKHQRKYTEAKTLLERALAAVKQELETQHSDMQTMHANYTLLSQAMDLVVEAEQTELER